MHRIFFIVVILAIILRIISIDDIQNQCEREIELIL